MRGKTKLKGFTTSLRSITPAQKVKVPSMPALRSPDLPELRPDRCPACGGELVSDENPKGKARHFRYACGAHGSHTEIFRNTMERWERPIIFADAEIDWRAPCPNAMQILMAERAALLDRPG